MYLTIQSCSSDGSSRYLPHGSVFEQHYSSYPKVRRKWSENLISSGKYIMKVAGSLRVKCLV